MRFRRRRAPVPPPSATPRAEYLALLDASVEAAAVAEKALAAGKPTDCPEVKEAQRAIRAANEYLADPDRLNAVLEATPR